MSGEIMCNEAEVNNILVGINAACTNLQNSINDLNGIDANASSLGLANFNTSQVQGSINSCKEKINSIIVSIYNVLKEWDNAEDETIRILIDLFSTLSEEDALVLMNKILSKEITIEEIETKGVQIWKEGV